MTSIKRVAAVLLAVLVPSTGASSLATAGVLYVDNRDGSDANDGRVQLVIGERNGPVRSIYRAVALANESDVINVRNTGLTYYDAITLAGSRCSGSESQPFQIVGNGAVVTGARPIPDSAWQEAGPDLWKLNTYRKGLFQLVLDGVAVEELTPPPGQTWTRLPELPAGQWCAFKGSIYYHARHNEEPALKPFRFAVEDCGLTLLDVEHVVVRDVTLRHFRVDGVNVSDRCRHVLLSNVQCLENGRAGLVAAGSSVARVANSRIEGNRKAAVLIMEAAALAIEDSTLDVEPELVPPVADRLPGTDRSPGA